MIGLFLAFISGAIVSYVIQLIQRKTKNGGTYWEGRGDGWSACEDMVLDRADESAKYTKRVIFDDLLV